jgi:hypothetical protein
LAVCKAVSTSPSTAKPKQESEYDLEKGLQGTVSGFGGQDIAMQKADFQTKEGIEGIKGFGTFVKIDPIAKKSQKLYFDILIFKEANGFNRLSSCMRKATNTPSRLPSACSIRSNFKKPRR